MTTPRYAAVPASFQNAGDSFVAGNSTVAKILVEPMPPAAATVTAPLYGGGCTILDLTATSTDASSKDVILYTGDALTTQDGTNTGAMTTTTSTIPRTTGSFITDGWQVGDLVMTFAPFGTAPNAAVDGIVCVVTTVAALTLTVNGTPIAALALATGTRIMKVVPLLRAPVAANSGTNGTLSNVRLMPGNSLDASAITTEHKLGATTALIAGMQAAVSALPAYVALSAQIARY